MIDARKKSGFAKMALKKASSHMKKVTKRNLQPIVRHSKMVAKYGKAAQRWAKKNPEHVKTIGRLAMEAIPYFI